MSRICKSVYEKKNSKKNYKWEKIKKKKFKTMHSTFKNVRK